MIWAKISPHLQDYASEVFGEIPSDEFMESYRNSLRTKINLSEEENFLLSEPEFGSLVAKLRKISFYMILNDPELNICLDVTPDYRLFS